MLDKIFMQIGKSAGGAFKKGKWVYKSLLGDEKEAIKAEFEIGYELAKSFAKSSTIIKNELVTAIGQNFKSNIVTGHKFNFYVITNNEPNAFAFPGGFIFITDSLLKLINSDKEQIAFVLAHEMGHVISGHSFNRLLTEYSITTLSSLIKTKGIIFSTAKKFSTKYIISAYSRENEYEADILGVKIMKNCGFDASKSVTLLNNLRQVSKENNFNYFSSHPTAEERIENVSKLLK